MFLDREAASVALEVLRGEDFYRPDHRMVFEAAEELYRSGSPIDVITVKNKLEEKGQFEQIAVAFLGKPFFGSRQFRHVLPLCGNRGGKTVAPSDSHCRRYFSAEL